MPRSRPLLPRPSRRGRLLALPALAATTGLLVAGCVSQQGTGQHAAQGGNGTVTITLTPNGCQPSPDSVPAGVVEFKVSNANADKVSEAELLTGGQMLGEQENLSPGLSGGFSLRLDGGRYQIYCPGAAQEKWDLTVTGQSAASWKDNPALVQATTDYGTWVTDQVGQLVTATQNFVTAVQAGDLDQAKLLYPQARVFYERVEPVAEIWGDLDTNIDGRVEDFDNPADFKGFHKLEQLIFQQQNLAGAGPIGAELLSNVQQLQTLVAKATYQPAEIADGATSLIDEIQSSKVTGEEDRYSHVDLVDFKANLDGSMQAFNDLVPALQKIDPDLVRVIQDRANAVNQALVPYQAQPGYLNTGYVDYSTVTADQRKALSQAVNALGEEMSKVAAKVA